MAEIKGKQKNWRALKFSKDYQEAKGGNALSVFIERELIREEEETKDKGGSRLDGGKN